MAPAKNAQSAFPAPIPGWGPPHLEALRPPLPYAVFQQWPGRSPGVEEPLAPGGALPEDCTGLPAQAFSTEQKWLKEGVLPDTPVSTSLRGVLEVEPWVLICIDRGTSQQYPNRWRFLKNHNIDSDCINPYGCG